MVPDANIVFGGSGAERTVTVTPANNQSGTVTITVTVSDGSDTSSDTFVLTVNAVNDPPVVDGIPDITFDEDDSTFLDLDGYVTDADNDTSEIEWSVEILNGSGLLATIPQNSKNKKKTNALLSAGNRKGKKSLKVEKSITNNGSQTSISSLTSNNSEDNLSITINSETHVATFKGKLDFFGADISVLFFATDADNQIGNDTTLVIVNPINDAPRFVAPLPPIQLMQGELYSIPRSLADLLVDDVDNADSTLTWSIEEHPYLSPEVTEDSITFFASTEWYGTDTLTVTISDGELSDQAPLIVTVHVAADTTPPNAPLNLTASLGESWFELSWENNTEDDMLAYNIYRSNDSTSITEEDLVATVLHPATAYNDSSAELGTKYYYGVTAIDTATNESEFSNIVNAKLSTDINEIFSAVPEKFDLSQNYPNPFNPSTTIKYALPERVHVKITIYNIRGQKVVQLLNEEIDTGYHSILWDGKENKSGIYFYHFQAGDFVSVRKSLMIK